MAKTLLKPPPFIEKIEIDPPVVHGVKFTYPINFFSLFIFFKKYYHRISGRSLRYWAETGEIDSFRESVWRNACFDEDGNQDVPIPLAAFRVMMWCDTMPHSMCAPGQGPVN